MSRPTRSATQLTIRLLGRDYPIACPEGERDALLDSAEYLSSRMGAIQRGGKALGNERIAVMAALNITRELLALQETLARSEQTHSPELSARLADLQTTIEAVLHPPGDIPSR